FILANHFSPILTSYSGITCFVLRKVHRLNILGSDGCNSNRSTNVRMLDDTFHRYGSGNEVNVVQMSVSINWFAMVFGQQLGISFQIYQRPINASLSMRVDGGRSVHLRTVKATCSIGNGDE